MLRGILGAFVTVAAVVAVDAHASVSIQVTWDALLHDSTAAVVATPIETRSVWENGRIYTYAHLRVDRAVAGELAAGGDPWVRTMGGVVGKVGQLVDGEPVLAPGQTSLLFLHPAPRLEGAAFVVTARGQGQFPLVADADPKAPPHLVRSSSAGALVPPRAPGPVPAPPMAADVVHGRLVDDVARDVVAAWDRTHAR
jgi:hypothetical protein